jgi:hypothetical protein
MLVIDVRNYDYFLWSKHYYKNKSTKTVGPTHKEVKSQGLFSCDKITHSGRQNSSGFIIEYVHLKLILVSMSLLFYVALPPLPAPLPSGSNRFLT